MDKDTYPDTGVVQQSEQFVPIKLNAEKEGKPQADKFNAHAYPTILFLSPDEKVVWKILGYMPPSGFLGQMKLARDAYVNGPKWEAALKTNGNDLSAILGLIPLRVQEERTEEAIALLKRAESLSPKPGTLDDAYNSVGDAYQNANKPALAIPYFEKAAKSADESKAAYALISIAYCHSMQGNLKPAIPALERLLKMGKGADEYRDQAKAMLERAEKG